MAPVYFGAEFLDSLYGDKLCSAVDSARKKLNPSYAINRREGLNVLLGQCKAFHGRTGLDEAERRVVFEAMQATSFAKRQEDVTPKIIAASTSSGAEGIVEEANRQLRK